MIGLKPDKFSSKRRDEPGGRDGTENLADASKIAAFGSCHICDKYAACEAANALEFKHDQLRSCGLRWSLQMKNEVNLFASIMRYVQIAAGALSPFLLAAAIGVLSMTPPEYSLARAFVIGSTLGGLVALILWTAYTTEQYSLKIGISIFLVLILGAGQPLSLWWISSKENQSTAAEERDAVEAATQNLSELDDYDVRKKVTILCSELRNFELSLTEEDRKLNMPIFDMKLPKDKQRELWREYSAKSWDFSTRKNSIFQRIYLPKALALLNTMRQRSSSSVFPPVSPEVHAPLNGMLAGARPASALADYLEQAAASMPP